MEFSINFLKQLAISVYDTVHPLLGTKEAAKKTRRGAGGDISMNIDLIAENIIINSLEKVNANLLLISEDKSKNPLGITFYYSLQSGIF